METTVVDVVVKASRGDLRKLRKRWKAREVDAVVVTTETGRRTQSVARVAQIYGARLRRGGHSRTRYGTGERRLAASSRNRHRPATKRFGALGAQNVAHFVGCASDDPGRRRAASAHFAFTPLAGVALQACDTGNTVRQKDG